MTLSINLIIVSVFSLIAIGFIIGYVACFISTKEKSNQENEAEANWTVNLISSLSERIFNQQDTIENLTSVCLNQKEKIDDMTVQIADMKIIRTKTETGNLLNENFFKNATFFSENNHDLFMKCIDEILVDTFIKKITYTINKDVGGKYNYRVVMNDEQIFKFNDIERFVSFLKSNYDLKQSLKASKN